MSVLEGLDILEQDWPVQELVSITIQMANLVYFYEKLEV
jgi:hypothetical protein